jgi:SNF2 family DNA or RNA helicase
MQAFETTTELMPWQEAAVSKLKPTRVGGLFMEMGTGKSRTAIELVKTRVHRIDKVVWFCPVSLKPTVRLEILKHTNCKDIYVFDDSTTSQNVPKNARWIIIGIESLSSSNRTVFATNSIITDKTFVILDESSYIKGHRAKRTERVILITEKAKYRFVLTGTPISQGVEDLFSQMKFLSPQILGYRSWYTFANNHLEYSEKHIGKIVRAHNTKYLAEKMAPYVYQVTKKECMELPGKKYNIKYFYMTRQQQKIYEFAKNEILFFLEDLDYFEPYTIFRLFGALQQIASGFWNRRIYTYKGRLSKFDRHKFIKFSDNRLPTLLTILSSIPSCDKVIIWAKYRYDIDRIVSKLHECYGADSVAVFTGSTPQNGRQNEVEKFRGPARFFVSTQSCGGHGLTLTEAKHVIFFSNSFKYSERLQAEDRCHRFGLDHEVTYWDILGPGIDERIWESLSRKENVADSFKREVDAIKEDRAKLKDLIKLL